MTDAELNAATEGLQFILDGYRDKNSWEGYPRMLRDGIAAITTLRAQLAEAEACNRGLVRLNEAIQARADRTEQRVATLEHEVRLREAALAAPEVMHEDAPAAIVGEIGNQIHNLGCELQNDEDVSLRLSDLACRCWDAAKLFPTDRTALDRMLAEAREKALREAAQVLTDEIDLARIAMPQVIPILSADRKAIIALIEKSDAR